YVPPTAVLGLSTDGSASEVHADALQLEYALSTMARNSMDAMPNGGGITIDARVVELDETPQGAHTQEMPAGRYAVIDFSDTGVGMDPLVMTRVFEPFFTTKGPGEGSGLGLASVYGIVRQSGGFVDVESTVNVGTTFHVYLPLATAPASSLPDFSGAMQHA